MAQVQIVCSLQSGTQERWRRLAQEVAGSRREQWTAFCRRARITHVQVWVVQLRRSELLRIVLHTQEPQQALLELAPAVQPFDRWLREQLQLVLGWNLQEMLPGQHHDLIFTWSSESVDP
jgi:hypothetical protein